jgi:glutamate N-acetyltransferase/amino-acid N-acetyltransferase
MKWIRGGVTAAEGFRASGISAGIKRSRKPDLSLVVGDRPCAAAAVFTRNRVQAAPVRISRERVRRGSAQAILINSGCANCLTGAAGRRDALRLGRGVASLLRIPERGILLGSTGLIGSRLPMERVERSLPRLIWQLSRSHHEAAAHAILTTDLRAKEAAVEGLIRGRRVRLGGMAKGAGMIAPSMATMLAVITTDAGVPGALLSRLLRGAAAETFNRVSVDGDMSTNDTVFALASGASGAAVRAGDAKAVGTLARMLHAVSERLALLLVKDGEGASKVMALDVAGARSAQEAERCARRIALSPLVKTMVAGSDPNPGRIAAAAGAARAWFRPEALEIRIEGVRLVGGGRVLPVPASVTRRLLARPVVRIRVDLHAGRAASRMLTCDLTEEYVRINAGYAT